MEVIFTKNSTGWWTVRKNKELPCGSISDDGLFFKPSQYGGLMIDFHVVRETALLMDRIRSEEDIEDARVIVTIEE